MSDHEPSSEVASPDIDARRRVALAVVLSGIFVTVMDSSIVNVAIPVIRNTLHASFGEAELTVASYALAFSAGMITGGRLGEHLRPASRFHGGVCSVHADVAALRGGAEH